MNGKVSLLNPLQVIRHGDAGLAERRHLGARPRIALLGNGKANARPLLDAVGESLREHLPGAEFARLDKPHSGFPADPEALAAFDAVVTAIGD